MINMGASDIGLIMEGAGRFAVMRVREHYYWE